MTNDNKEPVEEPREEALKHYVRPHVTVYGNLEDITQAISTGTKDGMTGSLII